MEAKEQLLDLFFYNPMKGYGVRELSRITHRNSKTVMKYLKILMQEGIIVKVKQKGKYPYYEAKRLSKQYKLVKSTAIVSKLAITGLVDFLEQNLKPKAMVLFGSAQKGTYLKDSDIDIFIQGKETNIDLSSYEKKIKHDIQLFFEENLKKLSEGLRNNIISGSTLSGGLTL